MEKQSCNLHQITFTTSKPLTEEDIESIKAYAEARATQSMKDVEYYSHVYGDWRPCSVQDSEFFVHNKYRVKLTPSEPTYRPWAPEEALGQKIREKEGEKVALITFATTRSVSAGGRTILRHLLLENYETIDGNPCGVLIEPEPETPAIDPNKEYDHTPGDPNPLASMVEVMVRHFETGDWHGPYYAINVAWRTIDKYKIVG